MQALLLIFHHGHASRVVCTESLEIIFTIFYIRRANLLWADKRL
jgi:hypothetical protein